MWTIAKDHFRRNWLLLSLGPVLFSLFFLVLLSVVDAESDDSQGARSVFLLALCAYWVLAFAIAETVNFNVVRTWRTLPLRTSTLANLAWGVTVLAPPLLLCPIVLPTVFLFFSFRQLGPQSLSTVFLFLLIASLLSGVVAFAKVSGSFQRIRAISSRSPYRSQWFSSPRTFCCLLLSLYTTALILYRIPIRLPGLGLIHLAGMVLAAGLTWKSYRMRSWLLDVNREKNGFGREAPAPDSAPIYRHSPLLALGHSLRNAVQETLFAPLCALGAGYVILYCVTWSGFRDNAGVIDYTLTATLPLLCVFLGPAAVSREISRIAMLKAVRSLPLTPNRCVLLLLSYPYALSLAVIPCASVSLWLAGSSHLSILVLAQLLLYAGLCPLGMYITARFGVRGTQLIGFLGLFVVAPGFLLLLAALNLRLAPFSGAFLGAGALVLAILGIVGYFGLLHLVKNNSRVYRRTFLPQQFDRS